MSDRPRLQLPPGRRRVLLHSCCAPCSGEVMEAMQALHDGAIGRVYFAKGWYANGRKPIGVGKVVPVPATLDFELWQGPAPRKPYKDNLVHYNWHWFWNWGTGKR